MAAGTSPMQTEPLHGDIKKKKGDTLDTGCRLFSFKMIAQRTAEVEVALFFFIEFRITGSGHIEDTVIGFDKKLDETAGLPVFCPNSHEIAEPFKFADIFPNVLFPLEKIVDKRIVFPFSA